jgi:NAD(P)-dependent dehydrogenase (short-subunit alcohol dehydrogenase family)
MFKGKCVLVTGGGSGIGRAIALEFSDKGADVVIFGRDEEKLESVRRECLSGKIEYMVCDVSDKTKVSNAIDDIIKVHKKIDVVICAAGVINVKNSDGTQDDKNVMDVNFFGTFHVCEKVIEYMKTNPTESCIINIASIAGMNGSGNFLSYSASKGAVISYTKGLARMYGPYGIRVNAISPGVIVTPMSYVENPDFDKNIEKRIQMHPLKRVGRPEDIAHVSTFLASENAGFITGQNIVVDGGLTI